MAGPHDIDRLLIREARAVTLDGGLDHWPFSNGGDENALSRPFAGGVEQIAEQFVEILRLGGERDIRRVAYTFSFPRLAGTPGRPHGAVFVFRGLELAPSRAELRVCRGTLICLGKAL
jgi:hypothetical protein